MKFSRSILLFLTLASGWSQAQTSYTSSTATGAWNTNRGNNATDGPGYTSAYTANNNVIFTCGNDSLAGMGATINVGNVTVNSGANVTFTAIGSTFATNGLVRTFNIASGSAFDFNGLSILCGGKPDLTGANINSNSSGVLNIGIDGEITLGNLTIADLIGWDWANANGGTYQLIAGDFTIDWGDTAFRDAGSAFNFGNGKQGYFTAGSLNVVVIPEPKAALLGGIGLLLILRRRRLH